LSEKIKCPWCEKVFDVDAIETAELWKERGQISVRIKPVWRIAMEYMDAFAARPGARITLKRKVRHLWGLVRLWETCEFEFDGKRYRTNREAVRNGMLAVCEAQKTGFNNHKYLFKCLLPTAQRVSAEGLTAEEEQRREEKRRNGEAGKRGTPVKQAARFMGQAGDDEAVTAEDFKKRRGIESLADQVGKELS